MHNTILLAAGSYKPAIKPSKTNMLMHFNGTISDATQLNAMSSSNISYISNQKFGNKSVTFTQAGYVSTALSSSLSYAGDFTIEAFVSIGTLTAENMVFSSGPGCYIDFYTGPGYNNGQPGILVSNQPSNSHVGLLTVQHGWSLGAIHHLAVCRKDTTLSIYSDGTFLGSVQNSNVWGNGLPTIGNYSSSLAYGWLGGIQEFRMSNICRYTGNFTPPTSPFVVD